MGMGWPVSSDKWKTPLVCSETHMGLTFCILVNLDTCYHVTVTDYDETTVSAMNE